MAVFVCWVKNINMAFTIVSAAVDDAPKDFLVQPMYYTACGA